MATYDVVIDRPSITVTVTANSEEAAGELAYTEYTKNYPHEQETGWVAEIDKMEDSFAPASYKINDLFKYNHIILRCIENTDSTQNSCDLCYFTNQPVDFCTTNFACSPSSRKDNKFVYFRNIAATDVNTDPTGLNAKDPGAKLDAGKPRAGMLNQFSKALLEVANVQTVGAKKYSEGGWLKVTNGYSRYTDAMMRHWLKEQQEEYDKETQLLHIAQVAWNALARLEFYLQEKEDAIRTNTSKSR